MPEGRGQRILKGPHRSRILPLVIRMILGIVFLLASIDKILHPEAFAEAITNYRILPDAIINLTAIVLPWIELMVGLCLVSGIWVPGASLLSALLLMVFLGAILFNVARGLDIECGCFILTDEADSTASMLWYVVRDALLLLMALYLVKKSRA
ncbi:MAG: MauE/DoxX family redox-associated membrane protein [Pseudomonadota bacterium]